MPKKVYKRPRQIAVYAPKAIEDKLRDECRRRRRKMGPTVLDILQEYFDKNLVPREPADAEARS